MIVRARAQTVPKQSRRARVYVFGTLGVEAPTVPYEPEDAQSTSVWRAYRRARVSAARDIARETLKTRGLVPGPLRLDREGLGFVIDGHEDIFITTRKEAAWST